jgi:hypothetical protein
MSANLACQQPIPLSQLRAGSMARMHSAELATEDCASTRHVPKVAHIAG